MCVSPLRLCEGGASSFVYFVPFVVKFRCVECRPGCGACCIAPSISSPIPGMPHGKPAGIPCVQLLPDYRCALFGRLERPAVCRSLRPNDAMCGANREEAMGFLAELERVTAAPRQGA